MVRIVLVHPQIPQNTGNIARTCAIVGAQLFLVRPLGFNLNEKTIKRSGMDYWESLDFKIVSSLEEAIEDLPAFFFSTKAKKLYTEIKYPKECALVFGSESHGLAQEVHDAYHEDFCTIPMRPDRRSLNLSNSAAIALYEWWRQFDFS